MHAPCLFPTLRYRNADAAIAWLTTILGFTEHAIYRDDSGIIVHAQLSIGSSILMLGQARDDAYGQMIAQGEARQSDALYLAVADIAPIHDRVLASGAVIESPPRDTEYGSREFICRDLEGQLWSIGTYWPQVAS